MRIFLACSMLVMFCVSALSTASYEHLERGATAACKVTIDQNAADIPDQRNRKRWVELPELVVEKELIVYHFYHDTTQPDRRIAMMLVVGTGGNMRIVWHVGESIRTYRRGETFVCERGPLYLHEQPLDLDFFRKLLARTSGTPT